MINAAIMTAGFYVPEHVLNNDFFVNNENNPYLVYQGRDSNGNPIFSEERIHLDNEKILRNTGGIRERRRMAEGETIEDMMEKAFKTSGFPPRILDGIIVATISDKIDFPSAACRIQHRLGAIRVHYTEDLKAACSGFTHALDHARLRVQDSGGYYAVFGLEALTRITDYTEVNCDIFGDGCGVVVIGPTIDKDRGILSAVFGSDTSGLDFIYKDKLEKLRMPNGHEVFKRAGRGMIDNAHKLTENAGIPESKVKLYIPHQANGRIIDFVELKIDPEKTGRIYRNIERYGNMSAATVPVALAEAMQNNRVKEDELVALVDMGAGLAFGGALIRI